ncbi:MAG: hypothetical protein ACLTLQ_05360 [[Clostridium] scindens]
MSIMACRVHSTRATMPCGPTIFPQPRTPRGAIEWIDSYSLGECISGSRQIYYE